MNPNNVDKVLIEQIVTAVESKIEYLNKNIKEIYTEEYIECIVTNLIRSKIDDNIREQVQEKLNGKMWEIVNRSINRSSDTDIIIDHEVAKFISSRKFVNMLQDNLLWHVKKKLTGDD